MRELEEKIRREVIRAVVDAARAEKLSLETDGVAFASERELLVLNAPVAGLEEVDVKSMLDGRFVLDRPVMYWYLAGEALRDERSPLREGFYAVVADQQRGVVGLRNSNGETVAEGNLEVCIQPPQGTPTEAVARVSVSGGIDKFDVNLKKHHIEVCGHASVSVGGAEVKIEGCVAVDW